MFTDPWTLQLLEKLHVKGGTDVPVADGGTGRSSHTAYAVVCGGTTATGPQQSIASVGTAGQVLTSNGAGALPTMQDAPAPAATWSIAVKSADENRNSDTFANDTDLQFAVLANTTYRFRALLVMRQHATPDIKICVSGPASPTLVFYHTRGIDAANGGTYDALLLHTAFGSAGNIAGGSTGTAFMEVEGVVQNGANAGTVAIQWAQLADSSGNPITLYKGSWLEYAAV